MDDKSLHDSTEFNKYANVARSDASMTRRFVNDDLYS